MPTLLLLCLLVVVADGGRATPAQGITMVTKTDSPDPAYVGNVLTYAIAVSGVADRDQSFNVVDRLDSRLRYYRGSVTPPDKAVGCKRAGSTVSCDLRVPIGGTETASILAVPIRVGRIRNIARAIPYNCDVDLGCPPSATSRPITTLIRSPIDLSIEAPRLTPVRENLLYRLTLTNCAGCLPIVGAEITNELPAGVKLQGATVGKQACSVEGTKVVCALDNLYAGGNATADIVVVPVAANPLEIVATASGAVKSVTAAIPVSARRSATTIASGTDLELTMVGSPPSVTVGQKVSYALSVRNKGRVPASGVDVVDTLPSGMTVESVEPPQRCATGEHRITCKLDSIPAGETKTVTITVTPTVVRAYRNKARVSTSTLDIDPSNDIAQAVTRVRAAADLSVAGHVVPNPVDVGKKLTYSLEVHNDGPSEASGVTLTSRLSQGKAVSAEPAHGTCSSQDRTTTCQLEALASGATTTVTIVATPESSGSIDNEVRVAASTADVDKADNTREIRAKVRSEVQLPSLSILDVDVDEGEDAVFQVTLSKPAHTEVRIGYETGDGTATEASGDYEREQGTLVFAPGETERKIAVTVGDDSRHEADESFVLRLVDPQGATIAREVGRARIRDDDAQRPAVSIRNVTVDEGETARFTVSLSGPAATRVPISYATIDGTARAANGDYEATHDSLVFEPGETEKSIAIVVRDDQRPEPDETFLLRISAPADAPVELGDPEAKATIVNDDAAPPSISINDVEVDEGEPAIFEVSLSSPAANRVRVAYTTTDGTAEVGGGDYRRAHGSMVFPPGDTQKEIVVRTVDDTRAEQGETVGVVLRDPEGATVEDRRGSALILDDDVAVSRLSIADSQSKGGDPVVFYVTLSEPPSETVRVTYETVDGTATAASGDYEPVGGELDFLPGTTVQSVSVTVASPEAGEKDETFGLQLRSPVGAALGDAEGQGVISSSEDGFPWIWLVVALGGAAVVGGGLALLRWLTHGGTASVLLIPPSTPRYLNLAVTDDSRDLVPASVTLAAARDYLVRIDIGELDVASLVTNPAQVEPGEPEKTRAGGSWLEVVLASTDVDVTESIHRFFLPDVGRSWVCDCVGPEHTCTEGERERYLYVPITTRERTPDAVVRCTIYQENNALQSAALHVVVADGTAKTGAQRATVDYALSRHFTRIGTLSPRLVNILTNESADGMHRIVVKDESRAIRVNLSDAAVGQVLATVRERLKHLGLGPNGDDPQFDDDNAKPATEFIADLKRLASLGSMFWSAVVPVRDDRLYLSERLRRRATIQVSRVTSVVFPWAVVYDIPHESQAEWRLCPLLARWDSARDDLESYPDTCPHEAAHGLNVLCPYGFWGFRHVIEQPPSVRLGVLKTVIQLAHDPQAVLARSLELDEELSRRHIDELRRRFDGTFQMAECESRNAVRAALADPALPLLYFYCHGKWGVFEDSSLRVPFLEIGRTDRIAPSDLSAWDDADGWDERHWGDVSPLVFINGCHTVELTPEGIANFVDAFAGIDAAGVIGTEIAVSQAVASEVAERFYEHFVGAPGQTAGTALYRVRVDLLQKGNVTGLVYTPFCSMDLALARGVT